MSTSDSKIVQPVGCSNPSNSHFSNPGFASNAASISGGKKMKRKTRKTKKSRKSGRKVKKSRKGKKTHKKSLKRAKKTKRSAKRRRSKKQRGGYAQYMSNIPDTPSYSTGAPPSLSPSESNLATPPPITKMNNCPKQ
jgi:hypothetical protein